jgi:hypothetical protein
VGRVCKFALIFAVFIASFPNSAKAEPDNIDVALLKNIPIFVQKLKDRNIRNFGVLPFRFKDDSGVSLTAGALIQTNLAARSERVFAYVRDIDDPINVVFGMLTQARKIDPVAAFDTPQSRQKLLAVKYNFPVEEMPPVELDGFVTGLIEVTKDWKQSTIYFESCDKKTGELSELGSFTIPTDRKMLTLLGHAYSLSASGWDARSLGVQTRSVFAMIEQDQRALTDTERSADSTTTSSRVGEPISGNPWTKLPVTLVIKYDGKPQTFLKDVYRSSYNFSIADPKPKQRVTFELKNNLTEKVAVVLSVNGKSLIYQEFADDPDGCNKFVLEAGKSYSIPGIYLPGLKTYQPLIGAEEQATAEIARRYPTEALGVICLTIYRLAPELDPNAISHRLPSTSAEKIQDEKPRNGVINATTGNNKVDSAAVANSKYRDVENELWDLVFDRGGANRTTATGSFHPNVKTNAAKTWDELSTNIGENMIQSSASRGLITPGESTQQQNLNSTKLGPVNRTDSVIIRYLSVPRN